MQILIAGQDFTDSYVTGTLKVIDRTGSDRSTISFLLADPLLALDEQAEVIVWDSAMHRRKEAAGRIRRPKRTNKGALSNDHPLFHEFQTLFSNGVGVVVEVECTGYNEDAKHQDYTAQVYENKTTGFIFRDMALNLPQFTHASVPIGGKLQPVFEARLTSVADVFDALAKLEGVQWWVDNDKALHFGNPALTPAPFEITDTTYQDITGTSLTVEPDSSNLANKLKMTYFQKYTQGWCDVNNLVATVIGSTDPNTGLRPKWTQHVTPGARFRVLNPPFSVSSGTFIVAEYTVQSVTDDETLILSSPYNEPTESEFNGVPNGPIPYIIDNIESGTSAQNLASQLRLKAITGGSGVYSGIIQSPGGQITFTQAQALLRQELALRANPTLNIEFKSTSHQIPGVIQAGMMVNFQLTQWGASAQLQIRELDKTDTGGVLADGYPLWQYGVKIEAKLFDLSAALVAATNDTINSQNLDPINIDDILGAYEGVIITEVARIIAPITQAETVQVTETAGITADGIEAPFYWAAPAPAAHDGHWSRSWWQ